MYIILRWSSVDVKSTMVGVNGINKHPQLSLHKSHTFKSLLFIAFGIQQCPKVIVYQLIYGTILNIVD